MKYTFTNPQMVVTLRKYSHCPCKACKSYQHELKCYCSRSYLTRLEEEGWIQQKIKLFLFLFFFHCKLFITLYPNILQKLELITIYSL